MTVVDWALAGQPSYQLVVGTPLTRRRQLEDGLCPAGMPAPLSYRHIGKQDKQSLCKALFLVRQTQLIREGLGQGEILINVTRTPIKKQWRLAKAVVSSGILQSRALWAGSCWMAQKYRENFLLVVRAGPVSHALEVPKDCVGRISPSCSHDTSSWNQNSAQKPTKRG